MTAFYQILLPAQILNSKHETRFGVWGHFKIVSYCFKQLTSAKKLDGFANAVWRNKSPGETFSLGDLFMVIIILNYFDRLTKTLLAGMARQKEAYQKRECCPKQKNVNPFVGRERDLLNQIF